MKKLKTEETKVERKQVSVKCPFCEKKILGTTKIHLKSNFEAHMDLKHKQEREEFEIE